MICKNCKSVMKIPRGKDFICGGLNSKPTKYKGDKIRLCLRGKHIEGGKGSLEATPMEALLMAAILSMCAAHYAEH